MEWKILTPEQTGVSSTRLYKAKEYAQYVSDQLGGSGGAVLVVRQDALIGEWYWGKRGPHKDSSPFDASTMTPVASVTKGVTATALALLLQDGVLWLDEPAYTYIPELNKGDLAKITIRHLATHSSGFPPGDPDYYGCWQDQLPGEHLSETFFRHAMIRVSRGPIFEPGTSHIYSDPAVFTLGEIIYRACGQRVPELIKQRVFDPLGLKRIGWDFGEDLIDDIAEMINPGWFNRNPDEKANRQIGSVAGGLITNARDLAAFGLMLLREGELGGVRIMAPLAVRLMTTCQYPLPGRSKYPHRGLFWWIKATPDTPELGNIVPVGTYCHGGAGHSVLVVMPALKMVAVMIRNRLGEPEDFIYNRDYPMFMDLVASAVDDVD